MDSVVLDRRQFVEGLKGGVAGVFDEREGEPQPSDLVELLSGKAIRDYVEQTNASVQTKINMLNERLIIKIKDEFLKNGLRYSEKERKAILKEYRGYFGKKIFDTSIFELYQRLHFFSMPDNGLNRRDMKFLFRSRHMMCMIWQRLLICISA